MIKITRISNDIDDHIFLLHFLSNMKNKFMMTPHWFLEKKMSEDNITMKDTVTFRFLSFVTWKLSYFSGIRDYFSKIIPVEKDKMISNYIRFDVNNQGANQWPKRKKKDMTDSIFFEIEQYCTISTFHQRNKMIFVFTLSYHPPQTKISNQKTSEYITQWFFRRQRFS